MKKSYFELQESEEIIRQEFGIWIRGGIKNQIGLFFLTNQRLLFLKQNPIFSTPLVRAIIMMFFPKWQQDLTFQIPLKDVTHFEHTTFAFNKRIILFHTTKGEEKFGVSTDFEQWEPILKKTLLPITLNSK